MTNYTKIKIKTTIKFEEKDSNIEDLPIMNISLLQ